MNCIMKMKYFIGIACLCVGMNMLCACGDDDTLIADPTETPDDGNADNIDVSNMTLKEACKDKFLFGAAMSDIHLEENPRDEYYLREQEVLQKHFNHLVAERCMKWEFIHPKKDEYNWDKADVLMQFAQRNNMQVTGHCLIWHTALPDWVWKSPDGSDVSKETLKQNMKEHITTVVGRYKGRILGWDVVNEAFNSDGTYRNTPYYRILGEEYIIWAYQCVKEADPDCELYYNDFELYYTPKRKAVLRMIGQLREHGIELDAVGLQAHMWMNNPSLEVYENLLQSLKSMGVKVMITEWDLSVTDKNNDIYPNGLPKDVDAKWNNRIVDFFKLFLRYDDIITRVTTWGISDNHSWKNDGCTNYPLLFDREQKAKPCVDEMMKAALADK